MIQSKKVLALIPARGGSKGIPRKNLLPIANKPLLAYSIEAALQSRYVDTVFVSTDDTEIQAAALSFGARADELRPVELAQDRSKTIDTVVYTVSFFQEHGDPHEILLLLQPTSPLRTAEDIDLALEIFIRNNCRGVISVSPVDNHPILIRSINADGELVNLLPCSSTVRRQDMPNYYRVNGAIYINLSSSLTAETSLNDNPIPYIMQREHAVDIDELSDVQMAEYYLKGRNLHA